MAGSGQTAQPPGARPRDEYPAVGRLLRPHGVQGLLLFEPASELASALAPGATVFVGEERARRVVRSLRAHGRQYLLSLEGCIDRSAAEAWRNAVVRIRFDQAAPLPDGTYFRWQILGMQVLSEDQEDLGKVAEILETGANDVYVVRSESGEEILLPAIESVILQVDLDENRMTVHLLPGLRSVPGG